MLTKLSIFGLHWGIGLAAVLLGASLAFAAEESDALSPDPRYTPDQVVRIQLEALQRNDIETTFEFASPANRAQTGPLERFVQMIEGSLYSPMIGSLAIEYLPIEMQDENARQRVRLTAETGEKIVYVFYLSKQVGSPYDDCWMTDAVLIESWEDSGVNI
jgi:hypothetical protein